MIQHVGEVGGSLIVEGFMGEEENFELDAQFDGEPMEVLEDRGDVVSGSGVGEESGGGVLDVL